MGKKDRRIAYLEAEIDKLRKLKCTNDTLQLAKYCSEIESVVNDQKFAPGSLKLIPRVSQAPSYYGVASDVEIVISAMQIPDIFQPEKKEPAEVELSQVLKKTVKEAELMSLKAEISLLNAKMVHLQYEIEQL